MRIVLDRWPGRSIALTLWCSRTGHHLALRHPTRKQQLMATDDWDKLTREVGHWVQKHHTSHIQQAALGRVDRTTGERYPLGKRIKAIRQQYRRGALPADRVAFFEDIPDWSWVVRNSRDPQLQEQLPQLFLRRLKQITHHLHQNDGVLRVDQMDTALQQAINHLRIAHRAGKLTTQQIDALNSATTRILDVDARRNAQTTRYTREFVRRAATWIEANPTLSLVDIANSTPARKDPLHPILLALQLRLRRHTGEQGPPLNDDELELLNQLPGWEQVAGELP